MWIIPKNYQLSSAFAADMVASKEDLTLPGLNIESCVMWRSKPSPLRTWSQRWNRVSWFQRLSSRILKPSQHTYFETALTSSLEDIRASRSQPQESDLAPKTPDTSGHLYGDTLNQLDLFGASLRTLKDTSALASEKSLATWKEQVIKQRGEYSQRLKSARLTSESGFTSWVTPTATDGNPIRGGDLYQTKNGTVRAKNKDGTTSQRGLIEQVMWASTEIGTPTASMTVRSKEFRKGRTPSPAEFVQMWPTPASRDYRSVTGREHLQRDNCMQNLNVAAVYRQTWPTPCARDYIGRSGAGRQERRGNPSDTLPNAVGNYLIPTVGDKNKVGHLNPDWVEWLMGVPTGWTDLGSWETE